MRVAEAVVQEDAVLHGERGEVAGAHAEDGELDARAAPAARRWKARPSRRSASSGSSGAKKSGFSEPAPFTTPKTSPSTPAVSR